MCVAPAGRCHGFPNRTLYLPLAPGAETQVNARFAGQQVTAVFRERIDSKPGSMIPLALAPHMAHLFNTENGKAMN